MVAIALDINTDAYIPSGDSRRWLDPIPHNRVIETEQFGELKTLSLFQGSGGTVSYQSLIPQTGSKTDIEASKGATLDEVVREIMETFNLTKEEQSSVFRVSSRKTLYNWIDGLTTPRKSAMNRIFELLDIARDWKSSGLKASSKDLRKPVIKGKCILELLSEDSLDKEKILFAGSRLNVFGEEPKTIPSPFV